MKPDAPTNLRSTWLRRLRVAIALVCLMGCFFTVAMWGGSYRYQVFAAIFSSPLVCEWNSVEGSVIFVTAIKENLEAEDSAHFYFIPIRRFDESNSNPNYYEALFDFEYYRAGGTVEIRCPHWPLALNLVLLAVLFRPPPRFRFGLRELFVIVSLAAVTLGAFEAVMRAVNLG